MFGIFSYINYWMKWSFQSLGLVKIIILFHFDETFIVFSGENTDRVLISGMYFGLKKTAKDYFLNVKFIEETRKGYRLNYIIPFNDRGSIENIFSAERIDFAIEDSILTKNFLNKDKKYCVEFKTEMLE